MVLDKYSWANEFEKFEKIIEYYSMVSGIELVLDTEFWHIAWVYDNNDWENMKIIVNPVLIKKQYWLSDEEIYVVLFHEIEHLKEYAKLKLSKNSDKFVEEINKRKKQHGNLHKYYHLEENFFRDIFVDNEVIGLYNAPVLKDALVWSLKDKMFKKHDYLKYDLCDKHWKVLKTEILPKHLQFLYTILRESFVKDKICIIDPHVRKIIERLDRNWAIKNVTTWYLKDRLQNMRKYIDPIFTRLLLEDIEKYKNLDMYYNNTPIRQHILENSLWKWDLDILMNSLEKTERSKNESSEENGERDICVV